MKQKLPPVDSGAAVDETRRASIAHISLGLGLIAFKLRAIDLIKMQDSCHDFKDRNKSDEVFFLLKLPMCSGWVDEA